MFFLSPAKLLVVLVVVMIVVGPDRLPQIARQIGAALQSLRQLHAKVDADLRDAVPNLPSTREIAQYTRRPTALLTKLMDLDGEGTADPVDQPVPDPGASAVIDTGPPLEADWPVDHAAPSAGPVGPEVPAADATSITAEEVATNGSAMGSSNGSSHAARPAARTTADGTPYGDPNMN